MTRPAVGPLPGGAEGWWIVTHWTQWPRALAVTPTEDEAALLRDDVRALARWRRPDEDGGAVLFSHGDDPEEALSSLSAWARGRARLLVAPRGALSVPLPPLESFLNSHLTLAVGDRQDRDHGLAHLLSHGYERVDTVEKPGEIAVRGEVLDLWAPGWDSPLRALWPGDFIESLRILNPSSGRSADPVPTVRVPPARLGAPSGGTATLLDHLGPGGVLFESRPSPTEPIVWTGAGFCHDPLAAPADPLPYQPAPPLAGQMDLLLSALGRWRADDWRVALFCENEGERERLRERLLEGDRSLAGALADGTVDLPIGPLARGFLDPFERRAVLSRGDIHGRTRRRFRLPRFVGGDPLGAVAELRRGDHVVHERFGIGRFTGLERKRVADAEADYLRLEYRGGDRVFVPLTEFQQVRRFIGTEGKRPVLSSLDTATWERTRQDVEQAVAALARDLLARAARRAGARGHGFPPDSHLEQEFAASFPYTLTPDQVRAIEDTKRDMMDPAPMDRLICGDVGYGKTEVALRAAFKAVAAGKQVALLAPTTILAEQHGRLFRERFSDYPVTVAVLSRFSGPAEQKRVIEDARRGRTDVVVGTHRLLSRDVAFKDLGLVIIDEEHRFGVKQKERCMALRDTVDVLALSATPIPRTLGQALGGIKALSLIESPPEGRLPIHTHVGPFDRRLLLAAVEAELRRGGQVFYVHNRVGSIERRRDWLVSTLKEHGLSARVGLAHGQMTPGPLEQVMWDFLRRNFDILLATSIIESGLDIPTVNTLVVEEAEDFGLAQLYQLRGRVGRERTRAYCYLFHSPGASLSDEAQQRLSALKEFASLGAGFKLAMRDLEIRGAGNLLGPQQHGHVNAVGLDLYGRLLSDEIAAQSAGGAPDQPRRPDPVLELPVSAYVPESHLPSETDRVVFYKRLLSCADTLELDRLRAELEDRCGRPPEPAERLFAVARLRLAARQVGAIYVGCVNRGVEFRFHDTVVLPPEAPAQLARAHGDQLSFLPGPPFGIRFDEPLPADLVGWATAFLSTPPLAPQAPANMV